MSTTQTTLEPEQADRLATDPTVGSQFFFAADGDGQLPRSIPAGPVELVIEATTPDRETPYWFDDAWWMAAYRHWKDESLVIRLMPSPGCLANSVVLHQLEMLRRIVPHWRIVAAVSANECPSGQTLQAGLPLDQIEVMPNSARTSSNGSTPSSRKYSNSANTNRPKAGRPTLTPGRKPAAADASSGKHNTDGPSASTPKMIYCDSTPEWVARFKSSPAVFGGK